MLVGVAEHGVGDDDQRMRGVRNSVGLPMTNGRNLFTDRSRRWRLIHSVEACVVEVGEQGLNQGVPTR